MPPAKTSPDSAYLSLQSAPPAPPPQVRVRIPPTRSQGHPEQETVSPSGKTTSESPGAPG